MNNINKMIGNIMGTPNIIQKGNIYIENIKGSGWVASAWIMGKYNKPIMIEASVPSTLSNARKSAKDFQRYHPNIKFKISEHKGTY